MSSNARHDNADAAASAGLAAAIAMAIAQIVFLAVGQTPLYALTIGASLASIAFGGTYAGVFFVSRAKHGRAVTTNATLPQP